MHNSFVYSPSRQHLLLSTESSKKYDLSHTFRVRQNKVAPKVFRCFLINRLEILQIYFLKCSTSKCQVKCDSIEKPRSYRLFNMTTYRFFSVKMLKLDQFNYIV